jgi:hypothetical protein
MKRSVYESSGLYYKHITIVNDDSSVVNMWRVSLTDDTRVAVYDRNMFIIQATRAAPVNSQTLG